MRLLIVGGAGYFGARLAETLVAEHEVVVTQRAFSPARDKWVRHAGLTSVSFDSDRDDALDVRGQFDAIINLAMPGAAEAGRDAASARIRAERTIHACLRLLDDSRADRLIHFSTFHVYGAGGRDRFDESDAPAPIHPYGETHLMVEQLLKNDARAWILRPSNMVGAPAHADLGDQAKLLFLDLCHQAAKGMMKLNNDGLSFRDFLPFHDAIDAVRILLATPKAEARLFNLASGHAMRLDAVASLIQSAAAVKPTVEFGVGADAFRSPFTVCIERLRALGWEPRASLADEASAIIRFFS